MSEINIRTAEIKDALGIAVVHVKMWQHAYKGLMPDALLDSLSIEKRTEGWKKQLEKPEKGSYAYVAEAGGEIAGSCTGGISRDEDATSERGELYGIYVHPDYISRGVGSKLMSCLFDTLRKENYKQVTLWVLDTNIKSRKWYESKGWKVEGKTKIDTRDGFDLNETRYIIEL